MISAIVNSQPFKMLIRFITSNTIQFLKLLNIDITSRNTKLEDMLNQQNAIIASLKTELKSERLKNIRLANVEAKLLETIRENIDNQIALRAQKGKYIRLLVKMEKKDEYLEEVRTYATELMMSEFNTRMKLYNLMPKRE
jgi:DNA invertase Pin-like site-specific DNA recombinase